jgi:hypothetical protein
MATVKQRKAADKIVENRGNVSKSMREAGYSEKSAKNPKNLTESKGFQELLDELLPDGFILQALRDDIQAKPGDRSRELTIATKIKGMEKNTLEVTGDSKLTVEIVSFGKD